MDGQGLYKEKKLIGGDTKYMEAELQIDSIAADGTVAGLQRQINPTTKAVLYEGPMVGMTINQATGKVIIKNVDEGKPGVANGIS